jgi:hypothetical protein
VIDSACGTIRDALPVLQPRQPPDRRFCTECGAVLSAGCPSCGAPTDAGEKFCGGCGERLPTATAGPGVLAPGRGLEAARPSGDLVGSTPLSQQLDAEEWRDRIGQYQLCGLIAGVFLWLACVRAGLS